MKKPIDPNLTGLGEDDFLLDIGNKKKEEVKITESDSSKSMDEPVFNVIEKTAQTRVRTSSSGEHRHHSSHHHSSSSHHHHHHHHHHHSRSSSHGFSSNVKDEEEKEKKTLPPALKIAIAIFAFLLIGVIVTVGTFFGLRNAGKKDIMPVVSEDTKYQEIIEYNGHTYKFNENVFALAFMGIDQRDMKTVDETDFVGASDADIVVAVDTVTGKTKVIAIPRDTMVDIEIYSKNGILLRTQNAQLCLAYAYGDGATQSCENTLGAISRILYNVPIQKYYALDLDGIAPLNDAIDGVTVTSLYDFKDKNIRVGDTVTLKGDMAETYVRQRDMDNIKASLNRTDRQIQYVKAFSQQAVPAVVRDFSTISKLYNTASGYSQTNLTLSNATYIGSLLLSKNVTDFDGYTLKGEMKASKDAILPDVVHAEFYPDEDYLMKTVLDVFYTQID